MLELKIIHCYQNEIKWCFCILSVLFYCLIASDSPKMTICGKSIDPLYGHLKACWDHSEQSQFQSREDRIKNLNL